MPHAAGTTYGRSRKQNGNIPESKDTFTNDVVFAAYGMRNVVANEVSSSEIYRAGFERNPSSLVGIIFSRR